MSWLEPGMITKLAASRIVLYFYIHVNPFINSCNECLSICPSFRLNFFRIKNDFWFWLVEADENQLFSAETDRNCLIPEKCGGFDKRADSYINLPLELYRLQISPVIWTYEAYLN